jgi:tetratricopeptide (TPR) repeat protein
MKVILLLCLVGSPLAALAAEAAAEADRLVAESRTALAAKDLPRAVQLAEQAVAAAPHRADLHAYLGSTYSQRIAEVNFMHQAMISGKMRASFEKAVELDPDHLPGRIGLARYYTHAPSIAGGSRMKAEAEAAQIKARDAFLGNLEFGHIAETFGDHEAALAAFLDLVALRPTDATGHERLARIQEKLGRPAEARAAYERALALDPARTRVKEALARLDAAR